MKTARASCGVPFLKAAVASVARGFKTDQVVHVDVRGAFFLTVFRIVERLDAKVHSAVMTVIVVAKAMYRTHVAERPYRVGVVSVGHCGSVIMVFCADTRGRTTNNWACCFSPLTVINIPASDTRRAIALALCSMGEGSTFESTVARVTRMENLNTDNWTEVKGMPTNLNT